MSASKPTAPPAPIRVADWKSYPPKGIAAVCGTHGPLTYADLYDGNERGLGVPWSQRSADLPASKGGRRAPQCRACRNGEVDEETGEKITSGWQGAPRLGGGMGTGVPAVPDAASLLDRLHALAEDGTTVTAKDITAARKHAEDVLVTGAVKVGAAVASRLPGVVKALTAKSTTAAARKAAVVKAHKVLRAHGAAQVERQRFDALTRTAPVNALSA